MSGHQNEELVADVAKLMAEEVVSLNTKLCQCLAVNKQRITLEKYLVHLARETNNMILFS